MTDLAKELRHLSETHGVLTDADRQVLARAATALSGEVDEAKFTALVRQHVTPMQDDMGRIHLMGLPNLFQALAGMRAVPKNCAVVPLKATHKMLDAAHAAGIAAKGYQGIWQAMLAAAPTPGGA